uniref:Uncharacterized protein n=1 Tax=Vespula pensylvanica TaxID=30213 RepID=A0A834NZF7_VESPE|nr:hypothetical protein H0235_009776 [Vespula pensylvanica]
MDYAEIELVTKSEGKSKYRSIFREKMRLGGRVNSGKRIFPSTFGIGDSSSSRTINFYDESEKERSWAIVTGVRIRTPLQSLNRMIMMQERETFDERKDRTTLNYMGQQQFQTIVTPSLDSAKKIEDDLVALKARLHHRFFLS